jgi:hypothetical protein
LQGERGAVVTKKEKKERYLKIPYHILNIGGLGLSEKVLLAHIFSFGKKGCWQSNETLAKNFFTTTRTIQRWLRRIHKHIQIKCPNGYYRTIWAKSHPEVRDGIKEWYKRQNEKKAKKAASPTTDMSHTHDKNDTLSMTNLSSKGRQECRTINNSTIKEIREDTTAQPAPLPAIRQASAVLEDRVNTDRETIESFKRSFGKDKRKPLTEKEKQERKNQLLRDLKAVENVEKVPAVAS